MKRTIIIVLALVLTVATPAIAATTPSTVTEYLQEILVSLTQPLQSTGNTSESLSTELAKLENDLTYLEEHWKPSILYLYKEGDECIDTTGGWKAINYNGFASNVAKNPDNIQIWDNSSSYNGTSMCTNKMIDVEGYTTLCVDVAVPTSYCSSTHNNGYSVWFTPKVPASDLYYECGSTYKAAGIFSISNGSIARKVYRVPIPAGVTKLSSVAVISASGAYGGHTMTTNTYNIWLER